MIDPHAHWQPVQRAPALREPRRVRNAGAVEVLKMRHGQASLAHPETAAA